MFIPYSQSNQNFAIILAAGASTRMGTCKTALPWLNNQTLLRYQAEQFLLADFIPIIVLGFHNGHRQKDRPFHSRVVINPTPEKGKTSSILTGLQSLPQEFSTVAISAVDQPRSAQIYQTLLQVHKQQEALITAPTYKEKLGHPLLFRNEMLPHLTTIHEETLGLRQIVQKFYAAIAKVEFTTPEVLIDLNTPTSYQLELQKMTVPVN